MTIKERIAEARGLCRDIERDLAQVEILRGAGNPEASAGYLEHISYGTLHELRTEVNLLLDHYGRVCANRATAKKAAR